MNAGKLPVGIESFEKIRKEGFYYIDKTRLLKELLENWGEVNLFTRPRRFGKTLTMSMLKSFFEIGTDPELFQGLAIADEKELCEQYLGKYPVVFVSLKGVDGLNFEQAYNSLRKILRTEASRFYFLKESSRIPSEDKSAFERILAECERKEDVSDGLRMLCELLYKHYGQKVILLIDEYDVPLDKAYQHGYYDEMVSLLRTLFGQALKTNDYLYFAVLTGCLRVSKESIFTGLNNFKVLSIMDVRYDEYFGFTDQEVQELLQDYDLTEHDTKFRDWYDGYRFGNADVYCPWDVINYADALRFSPTAQPKVYWLNTSGNELVRRVIDNVSTGTEQMEIEQLIAGESIFHAIDENMTYQDIGGSSDNLWSVLLMTGYLTTRGEPQGDVYELAVPNREIREIYIQQARRWFEKKAVSETAKLTALYAALETGDAQKIEEMLNDQMMDTISFHDAYETFYHGFLLALLNTCADWKVRSNRETGKGRSDILAERKDRRCGFVIEVKEVKSYEKMETACHNAIRQIEEKDYVAGLRRSRVAEILIYGIAFHDKECRVIAKRAVR